MGGRFLAILAGIAVLAMVAGGCGGDEEAGGETTVTKAQFIKQADALCVKANKRFGREFKAFAKENQQKQPGKSVRAEGIEVGEEIFVPNAESRAEALAELPPPSGEEDRIAAILEAIEEGVEKAEENPASLYSRTNYPFARANQLQQDYGFRFCGAGIAE